MGLPRDYYLTFASDGDEVTRNMDGSAVNEVMMETLGWDRPTQRHFRSVRLYNTGTRVPPLLLFVYGRVSTIIHR